jgi:hypothetical protein
MVEFRLRRADDAPATRPHTQTEIHVIVADGEMILFQPADRFEHIAPDRHAGPGDGGDGSGVAQHPARAGLASRRATHHMRGNGAGTERDAGVLQSPVGIEQPGADGTDLVPSRERNHGPQPVGMDRLGVIVEQHQDFAARRTGGTVVHGRPIERTWVVQHADARVGGEPEQQPRRPPPAAAIVDDQQLQVGIISAIQD